ncbi:MAG TPA: hypothetical protein VMZ53_05980 [Kofleriaceae bacterium]|nr:hypothetical protein [Kofleriaceae bacterium]
MRWPVVLSVLGACAPVPNPPSFALDVAQVDNNGESINLRFGELGMQLAPMTSIQLPLVLTPDGGATNLLEPPPATNPCGEGYAGINLNPIARASASTMIGGSTVRQLLSGPAVARVAVEYTVPYMCNGNRELKGKTTFTLLPSGRIERLDENVVASMTNVPDTASCGCATAPDNAIYYSSFWSFKPGTDKTPTDTTRGSETGPGCTIEASGDTIAVDYHNSEQRGLNGTHLVYFTTSVPPLTKIEPQTAQSSLVIGKNLRCADALARLEDPPIMVDDKMVTAKQGIYVDTVNHASRAEITTQFPVLHGFALEIPLNGATHARVLKNGDPFPFAVETDGDNPVFWFPDPLVLGDTIVIDQFSE